jgi:phosphatidylglycerol---prolipoprotein diacylglyceryl transferase
MPDGFFIGPIKIYFYAIIVMAGAMAAAWLSTVEAKRRGEDPEFVWDGLLWVLFAGIVGARLWHVFTPPPSMVEQGITTWYYLTHPLDLINLRAGGLGIPGAVIGGALALFFYARRRGVNFLIWTDIVAPGLALAQAIGRWGNYFNQEVYGKPTDVPWAIFIDAQHRLPGYETFSYYHPLFLYESLWNLANMVLLLWLGRRLTNRLLPGDLFLTYMITYPVGRFALEFLRLDAAQLGGINANQTLMAIVALLAAGSLFLRHRTAANPSGKKPGKNK